MLQEEKAILLSVDRAKSSTNNSQTIGRNGEIPLIEFLNRYLPITLKAASGHFITKEGSLSPQIDVLILDSRYPLLSQNIDGSVLAMAHSVIEVIEVKTNLASKDVQSIAVNSQKIMEMMKNAPLFGEYGSWGAITTSAIAYNCAQSLDTLENKYIKFNNPGKASTDITILRHKEKDLMPTGGVGGVLHFEPVDDPNLAMIPKDDPRYQIKDDYIFMSTTSHTPLSDFYYNLVQSAYYSLGERNFTFDEIARHFMDYMNWATATNYEQRRN